MSAGKHNLQAEQDATFEQSITWNDSAGSPIDLTGYTAKMQIRKSVNSEIIHELNTENGGITFPTPTTGEIVLNIPYAVMTAINSGIYKYDLVVTLGAIVKRLMEGSFSIDPSITK